MHDESEEVKEVYAVFGLAVYAAQCLEHGLVNAMLCLRLIPEKRPSVNTRSEWNQEVDAFYETEFRKTLGQMIAAFQKYAEVPADLAEHLATALDIRNWLSHHYFRERAEDFMFSKGREKMIAELHSFVEKITAADERLDNYLAPVLQKYHITKESLAEVEAQMLKKKGEELASSD